MIKYYIQDTTLPQPQQLVIAKSIDAVVKHLEGTVQRKFRLTRKQYMENLIDLGYGYDDNEGETFTQAMAEHFNIGVCQDNRFIRTSVHAARRNERNKTEYGG